MGIMVDWTSMTGNKNQYENQSAIQSIPLDP